MGDRPSINAEISLIDEFWLWWRTGADQLAAAIETGEFGPVQEQMSHLITSIGKGMQWEIGPGVVAAHALCVTANGDPRLRPLTERWLRAAPAADPTWEYRAARRADPGALAHKLRFADWELDLSQTRLSLTVDEQSLLIDVHTYHPMFREMPDQAAVNVSFLVLGWLLGEDDIERWVGEVATSTHEPPDALPVGALSETVLAMTVRHPEPVWVTMQGHGDDGARLLAVAMRPLRWIDHPLFDQHVGVTLGYPARDPEDLPSGEVLVELRDLEDELTQLVGSRALLVAHESGRGRRVLHLYCDSTDATVIATIQRWVSQCRTASLETHVDPAWDEVRHLR